MSNEQKFKIIQSEKWIEFLEGFGVAMRIFSFGMLSILNKDTPFLTMWVINTIDAVILTWCAWERGNRPYMLLNFFWLVVGAIGIYNSL
jgi:hypothetical protein